MSLSPVGERGVGPFRASNYYRRFEQYVREASDEILRWYWDYAKGVVTNCGTHFGPWTCMRPRRCVPQGENTC